MYLVFVTMLVLRCNDVVVVVVAVEAVAATSFSVVIRKICYSEKGTRLDKERRDHHFCACNI